ncbi:MAG: hypothetical protein GDA48_25995 [Hormoscilla sp. GM102CHS1]|nr:hypothetical protein [Hormoscilla sp. GM102CHS1]
MSASVLGESRRQAGRLSEEGASLVKEIQPAQAGFVYVARPFRAGAAGGRRSMELVEDWGNREPNM